MNELRKIISGGQTGADQGALDGAIACSFPYGGAIPAGRKTEAGPLPPGYLMDELASGHYPDRTAANVEDSDGTLILSYGVLKGGSALTRRLAEQKAKPWLHIDFSRTAVTEAVSLVRRWLGEHRIGVLNVAGARASSDPQIYRSTRELIVALLGAATGVPHG